MQQAGKDVIIQEIKGEEVGAARSGVENMRSSWGLIPAPRIPTLFYVVKCLAVGLYLR
jgi:hypothetical protein